MRKETAQHRRIVETFLVKQAIIYQRNICCFLRAPACKQAENRWFNFLERKTEIPFQEKSIAIFLQNEQYLLSGIGVEKTGKNFGRNTFLVTEGPLSGFICAHSDSKGIDYYAIRPLMPLDLIPKNDSVSIPYGYSITSIIKMIKEKGIPINERLFYRNIFFIEDYLDSFRNCKRD